MSVLEEIALRQSILYGGVALGALFALIYAAVFCHRPASWPKTLVKAVPMLAFAAAGMVNFADPLVIAALVLSAIGDVALSREGQRAFLSGLVAFALAHLLYVILFMGLRPDDAGGLPPLLPTLALLALALSTEIWLTPHAGALRGAVRVYVLLITAMGLAALSLPEGRGLAVLGALAFILSDAILALQRFRMADTSRWQVPASVALWLLYAGGQAAILLGAGFARPIFHL
ncbi:MAG: lysoplasmalogenase [Rhodobacteraceae bacterium]|nr:MAG: lysoplasmalogenase [Paracoccaceae bacterium]